MSIFQLWLMLGQSLGALPALPPGTTVQLVSTDLLTIYATAEVEAGRVVFSDPLRPGQELRLLIFPPDASAQQFAQALAGATALPARVAEGGTDLLMAIPGSGEEVSLRRWLLEERGLTLVIPRR